MSLPADLAATLGPAEAPGGREVVVTGSVRDGVFVAKADSLVTLCPSKFTDRPDDSTPS